MKNEFKNYKNVSHFANKWDLSERSVRNYCANGRISGAKLVGKTWYIPENAKLPDGAKKAKKKELFV